MKHKYCVDIEQIRSFSMVVEAENEEEAKEEAMWQLLKHGENEFFDGEEWETNATRADDPYEN